MSFFRYFSIICFIVLVGLAIMMGYSGRKYIEDHIIQDIASDMGQTISEDFTRRVWIPNRRTLNRLPCVSENCNTDQVQNLINSFIRTKPVLLVRVYRNDEAQQNIITGEAFSTLGPAYSKAVFEAVADGQMSRNVLRNYQQKGFEGQALQMMYPIVLKGETRTSTPAVIEIFYDISAHMDKVQIMQWGGVGAIMFLAFLLLVSLLVAMNRSERVVAQQHEDNVELVKEKTAAQAENDAKSKFLANISHELRTPLNSIIGFSEIMKNDTSGNIINQEYIRYVNDIHSSGTHLLSLINDILDFSKAEAGKLSMEFEDVDVSKLLRKSSRLIMPRADSAGIKIVTQIPQETYILRTDAKRLKQIILNFLSNSVKFTEAGGRILLGAWHDVKENKFCIEVEDTGIGIAAKDIAKVMSTFGQVESELSRKHEGTGLGLPLSKKLVELMGGTFSIESEEGKGTRIVITLPYNPDETGKLDSLS